MGSRHMRRVKASLMGEERLPSACRLAMVYMAWHALDGKGRDPEDPSGIYWGGHAELALEIFGATVKPISRKRMVTKVIRELEIRKLIAPYATTPGGRIAYRLLPTETDMGGDSLVTPNGDS
jgi:hypothetical protein